MQIHLLAIGGKMSDWVERGYTEYAKRLPKECRLTLHALPLPHRGKGADLLRLRQQEAAALDAATPKGAHRVALEIHGKAHSTAQLAERLQVWLHHGRDVALWVGGPDGIEPTFSAGADEFWSLSPLTLPHPLVRIVIAEQIYRAWSLLQGHPYHR
ncbi:MAG: 23S rRNA (pseudouridine(1915)-N(3))-methyltransferase RlmH [Gammaproteobacteria bacterium]|nr:23S rRNA (pseudouridine(1915)-N(3))-methyltransferase RlmH [Gammaproteobacteria bacterium]